MRVFLFLALVFCVPLEGVTTNHRAWVSAWKELSKKGIDKNELVLASLVEKQLSKDGITVDTEEELLQTPTVDPDALIKAAQGAMSDLHRLSKVQNTQEKTEECCASHRIGSLDDLSHQATDVLERLGAIPLTRVLDRDDRDVLAGRIPEATRRALWQRIMMSRGKHHGGDGKQNHAGKNGKGGNGGGGGKGKGPLGKGKGNGGKHTAPPRHPDGVEEVEAETVDAFTPEEEYAHHHHHHHHHADGSDDSSSSDTSSTDTSGDNTSPSVTELKNKIAQLINKIKEHSQSSEGLTKSVIEGKELMKLYKQVKSATELELLKYTVNTQTMNFPVEADDVVDSPLDQNAASWGMSGGIVADWISPFAGQGGQNEYNANICCDLNGGGGTGPAPIIPASSTGSDTGGTGGSDTGGTAGSTTTPAPAVSSAAPVVQKSSSGGSLLQAAATITTNTNANANANANANSNLIPGLGEIHVYRLYPGPTTSVTPGDVPGLPMMTLPADVPGKVTVLPAPNNGPSSDGMLHGVRFEQGQAQQQQQQAQQKQQTQQQQTTTTTQAKTTTTTTTPPPVAASPAAPISNAPSGMITPAIDPSLHLTPEQLNALGADGAALVRPATTPLPFSAGMIPASYDGAALLQQGELQGNANGELTADQLWALLREQDQRRTNPQPAPVEKQMTPAEMLKLELDVLRKQMQH